MEKLIRALRCSATGHGGDFRCPEDCPYREIEKRGCAYDIDCNRTLVMLYAADALEKYQRFKWVPVKVRPTTEEDEIDMHEYPWFLDFPLPDDGERILVSRNGYVDTDENQTYDGTSYYLDGCGDWADVEAWMPLPEPYKKEEE